MNYTAREVAEKLQKEGYADITTRTVNYYAFEKKMFDVSLTGKKCFTDKEIEKIKAIKHLQKTTSFTLSQIKDIISTYSFEDIMARVSPVVYEDVKDFYQSPGYTTSFLAASTGTLASSDAVNTAFSTGTILGGPFSTVAHSAHNTGSVPFAAEKNKTIEVNPLVTLVVSHEVDTDTLTKLVTSVNQITQNYQIPRKDDEDED